MEAGGAMAEVGLLPFACIALQVSRAVLPRYRSRFSKRQFTQPQLLAILCLMRYEDWTFREAEVRLGEHRELRQVLGLVSVPDFTTLYRFLQRLDDQTIDRAVGETVRRLRGSLRQKRKRARVAVDATGLAQGAVSTFFVRRMHHHGQKPLPWRHWLKWVMAVERLRKFACRHRSCFPANPHRAGAGGRGVRQRAQSHLHPQTPRSAERDSRQAGEENLARTRSACRDAECLPTTALPPPRPDREPVLFGQTKTLGSRPRSLAAYADASSPAARIEFQSVSVETSPPFLEDVNRASCSLLFTLRAAAKIGCRRVVMFVVGGKDLVYQRQIALVPNFFKQTTYDSLVV